MPKLTNKFRSERLECGEHHRGRLQRVGTEIPLPPVRVLRRGDSQRADRPDRGGRRRQKRRADAFTHRHQRLPVLHHSLGRAAAAGGGELRGKRQFDG